jgi:hypothetical protein
MGDDLEPTELSWNLHGKGKTFSFISLLMFIRYFSHKQQEEEV